LENLKTFSPSFDTEPSFELSPTSTSSPSISSTSLPAFSLGHTSDVHQLPLSDLKPPLCIISIIS
jgi:hypothetical protein